MILILRVEGQNRLLVSSDKKSWRETTGHHVQPGHVETTTNKAFSRDWESDHNEVTL